MGFHAQGRSTGIDGGSTKADLLYQLGQSRWAIDAEVFQTITTDSHLKRPSVHQDSDQALVVLI